MSRLIIKNSGTSETIVIVIEYTNLEITKGRNISSERQMASINSKNSDNLFKPGMAVWTMKGKKYWWPGTIVRRREIPAELNYYKMKRKVESSIAVVHFNSDDSYVIVTDANKIYLYSCAEKLNFLKEGYFLYIKQKSTGILPGCFDMKNFIKDVIAVEVEMKDGDINIFQQFNEIEETPKLTFHELPTTTVTLRETSDNTDTQITPKCTIYIDKLPERGILYCRYCCNNFSHKNYEVLKIHMRSCFYK